MLHVFDGGIGLNVRVKLVFDARFFQQVRHLLRNAELHQIGVRCDKRLLETAAFDLFRDRLDRARAMVRGFVEHELVH